MYITILSGKQVFYKARDNVLWARHLQNPLIRRGIFAGRLVALIFASCILLSPAFALAQTEPERLLPRAPVSAHLATALENSDAQVSFLVLMKNQVDVKKVLYSVGAQHASREMRTEILYPTLANHALTDQRAIRSLLDRRGVSYQPFYIVNMLEVEGDAALVDLLRSRSDVARIELNPSINSNHSLGKVAESDGESNAAERLAWIYRTEQAAAALPYGLEDTGAPDVWTLGYRGQGITLASQDTGVQWDHPALQEAYRGWDSARGSSTHVYNWFDAWNRSGRPPSCAGDAQVPCDDNGHGTHTVGTMLGDATGDGRTIIGVAPDADWIGCRNMILGVGKPSSYTACFEFFFAPYPQDGDKFTDGRPELGANVINNSWGCPPSEGCDAESLRQVVETVRAAGQFVISSAGNEGCPSILNPTTMHPVAIHDAAFTVGAHANGGGIASFSSRGPGNTNERDRFKPDLTAPGVGIESTYINNSYITLQGTSMASPHVAGAAALLWSAVPALKDNIDLSEQVLIKSAVPAPAGGCGVAEPQTVPNNAYGFGRLNIRSAVELAQTPASATVQILNCNERPLSGAELQLIDQYTGYTYKALADEAGQAFIPALYSSVAPETSESNTYTVTVLAGDATFAPAVTTVEAGRQISMTVEAVACYQPASVTVEIYFGSRIVSGTGSVILVDKETGRRYVEPIPTDTTTTLPPTSVEFSDVMAGDYWVVATVDSFVKEDASVEVAPGEENVVQLRLDRNLFFPVMMN